MSIAVEVPGSPEFRPMPFSSDGPLMHCVMVTGAAPERIPFAVNAVASFWCQTYPNRRLLIINQGSRSFRAAGIPADRLTEVRVSPGLPLGVLRNKAFAHMPENAYWVQWDDDDWRHPDLISRQFASLRESGADGCALRNQVKYHKGLNSAWDHTLPDTFFGFAGTIMLPCRCPLRYPETSSHEDTAFWASFLARYRAIQSELPHHFYVRFIHGGNISPHLRGIKRPDNDWSVSLESEAYLMRTLPLYGIAPEILGSRASSDRSPFVGP